MCYLVQNYLADRCKKAAPEICRGWVKAVCGSFFFGATLFSSFAQSEEGEFNYDGDNTPPSLSPFTYTNNETGLTITGYTGTGGVVEIPGTIGGVAVNADAKIQMMAYDATGGSEGEMTVEGRLPVAAQLASAIDKNLTGTLRDKMVDAREIDLAARRINLSNATMVAMDAIHVRARTILVQNSFMTVIRKSGSINMYVQSGSVNQNFGSVVAGRLNFAGLNTFTIGNNSFAIGNQTQLNAAYGTNLIEIPNDETPQAGKVNVLKM